MNLPGFGAGQVDIEEAKKLEKISNFRNFCFKSMDYVTVNENKFVEFNDFRKKVFGNYSKGNVINDYADLFKNNALKIRYSKNF